MNHSQPNQDQPRKVEVSTIIAEQEARLQLENPNDIMLFGLTMLLLRSLTTFDHPKAEKTAAIGLKLTINALKTFCADNHFSPFKHVEPCYKIITHDMSESEIGVYKGRLEILMQNDAFVALDAEAQMKEA